MLARKREPNYGNSKNYTKNQVRQCNPDSADDDPDDIENGRQATRISRHFTNLLSKWKQSQKPDFETLNTKRNTNDCQAKYKSGNHVLKKNEEAAKNEPDNIAK
jgi:hypothetical protein